MYVAHQYIEGLVNEQFHVNSNQFRYHMRTFHLHKCRPGSGGF